MGRSIAIVLVVWAAVYLPGLGLPEIKGEEGRRILPAVTMLDTGNAAHDARELFRSYVVPMIGSEPYLRKPPLVNWLVAGSFKLFGARDEWTARLPSALCVLLVALAFVTVARGALGRGALWAAFAWLLNFGILEKGRLIEIEALYVSLFGLALICWLAFWQERRSPWLTWLIPAIFLGAGLLAKGPVHLLFFYSVVAAVLWRDRQLRALTHPAHFIGLILMLGIFAAWALPYLEMLRDTRVAGVWSRQFSGRVAGEDFQLNHWLLNSPRAVAYFLPWAALLPFVRVNLLSDQRERALAKGVVWGTAIPFLVVNLLPGDLPRYSMPALVPACWLVGVAVNANAFAWRVRLGRWGMDFS
ncbi:MAG: glycosyltransferase family 39 protein, partial [Chthoniobacterales bacterium]|nr:glycosyltransferase family 39 protein [Chthoniobacterales bacterium]